MNPALLKFWRYFIRQGKGILNAFEQALNEIEREGVDPEAAARAEAVIAPTRKLTQEDLAEIEKLITVYNGRQ
jgi:hypothetical protein